MEYVIPGENFIEQVHKAYFLNSYEIDPYVKYDKLRCNNQTEYITALNLLYKNRYIEYDEYEDCLRKLYIDLHNKKQLKMIKNEEYRLVKTKDDRLNLVCKNRCLFFKKKDNGIIIGAFNRTEDNKGLEERKIPFLIKKDSPIYACLDIYHMLNNDSSISIRSKYNKNNIEVDKTEDDNYILTFNKVKEDKCLSNSVVGGLYIEESNNAYSLINALYAVMNSYTKQKGKQKVKK